MAVDRTGLFAEPYGAVVGAPFVAIGLGYLLAYGLRDVGLGIVFGPAFVIYGLAESLPATRRRLVGTLRAASVCYAALSLLALHVAF